MQSIAEYKVLRMHSLLRPGLAAVLPGHAPIDTRLRRAFDNVQIQLDASINQAQFLA
jgi:hypothetical protein